MKRFTKIILIISGVCLVLGLACGLAATLIFGASLPQMIRNNELSIYWDRTGLHSGKDDENTQYQESFSKSADAVDSLEIDVDAGEVYLRTVEAGSDITVAVTEGDASVLSAALSQDKRLKVATKDRFRMMGGRRHIVIEICVPEDKVFQSVMINMDAGSLSADALAAEKMLSIDINAGSVEIENVQSGKTIVDIDAGNVSIGNAQMNHLQLDMDAGGVEMLNTHVSGDIQIDVDAGSADLYLTNIENDFNYQIESALGSVTVGDNEWSGINRNFNINNQADRKMYLDVDAGSVYVEFVGD